MIVDQLYHKDLETGLQDFIMTILLYQAGERVTPKPMTLNSAGR